MTLSSRPSCVHFADYGSSTKYVNDVQGYNARLDELQAALLRVKLRHLDDWNLRRRKVADWYQQNLHSFFPDVVLPNISSDASSSWHLFVVRTEDREKLKGRLESAGIGSSSITRFRHIFSKHMPASELRKAACRSRKGLLPRYSAFPWGLIFRRRPLRPRWPASGESDVQSRMLSPPRLQVLS